MPYVKFSTANRHLSPPYNGLDDAIRDYPRQLARQARKAAGLPASSDVGKLSELILALRSSVEAHLGGRKISGATASAPYLAALYEEDLADAFEYAGLIYIPHWPYTLNHLFTEHSAVYAGNGFGLCSNYTDIDACERERFNPPNQPINENVLSVSYTRAILTSTWGEVGMWFGGPGWDLRVVDGNLGWEKRDENPKEDFYWAAVRDVIIKPVLLANNLIRRNTTKVLLHGECASDERFLEVLRDAVDSVMPNTTGIFAADPIYAAARGAAEMAKRTYYAYNHTKPAQ
jgi:hypothetical protein